MTHQESVDRITKEVAQYSLSKLKNSQELMTKFAYMNSPEDRIELKAINERLKQLGVN